MPANLSHALPSLKLFSTCTRYFAIFGLVIAMPSYATGALLHCDSPTTPVYRTNTCMQTGATVDLRTVFPAGEEEQQAPPIGNNDKVQVAQVENGHDKAHPDAVTERERAQREKDAQQARCEQYLADRQRTEQATQPQHRNRVRANDDARALRSQQFTECFAR